VSGFIRTGAILAAITLGAVLPGAHVLAWVIRWLIVGMLFLVFLQARLSRAALRPAHWRLLGANLGLGLGGWLLGWLAGGREVALATFFCGIAPTAIAAPVIISFLGGQVEFVVGSFLLTNLTVAALMPLVLPVVLGRPTPDAFSHVLGSVGLVVFVPLVLAHLVRALRPAAETWPSRLRNVSFSMWLVSMFLITANASHYVREHAETPLLLLLRIAGASLVLCAVNFALGHWLGGEEFRRESSQSLGQKNTTFTIYLALLYASPLVALGPTFYVVWHNLWNSWQLHRSSRLRPPASEPGHPHP
jgi:BASS family bile acid:Na+ symporter